MINFCKGMINTPGAVSFRDDWKGDALYRTFIKTMSIFFVLELVAFYLYT